MKLTEHFKLNEFTASSTAKLRGIDNTPTDIIVARILNLCRLVLEPLRQAYGKPIIISSGYRCPALNKAVGGVSTSQHMKGEAADLHLPSMKVGWMWFEYIKEHLPFDQLIMEHDKNGNYWIHVSCKEDVSKNRKQVISNLLKK